MKVFVAMISIAFGFGVARAQEGIYQLGADSQRQPGVPRGEIIQQVWDSSQVYPNTTRDWWIYVPAEYDGQTPAALMVFQDGRSYLDEEGDVRAPVVFDNLIHAGEMPVTIAVFVNPGRFIAENAEESSSNRSVEYDTLSGRYARFLIDEIIAEVRNRYRITDDPEGWAIAGMSSGGIAAFTAAWERPDAFRKVVSHVGSFTNIRGGHVYPALVRGTDPKPLRVFLQSGTGDLNNRAGNWFLSNQQMASALEFAGYDVDAVWGEGGHSREHGGALFPDTLRWLWRDYDPAP